MYSQTSAPEEGQGLLTELVAKISFLLEEREGYRASFMARLTALSPGALRSESEKPDLSVSLGDSFELFALQSSYVAQHSVRGWRPAGDVARIPSKPYSSGGAADFGLTLDALRAFLELGAPRLLLHLFPRDDAELIGGFPSFIAPST